MERSRSNSVGSRPPDQLDGGIDEPATSAGGPILRRLPFERGSLSSRLIAAFLLAILITSVAAGLPAYWITRGELENQAWGRVQAGLGTSSSLLEAEAERLDNLAALAAERPTLRGILQGSVDGDLPAYLTSFRIGAGLDLLVVLDPSATPLASSPSGLAIGEISPGAKPGFVRLSQPPALALLALRPIDMEANAARLGWVVAGMLLDEQFVQGLAQRTGLEHSLLIDNERRASSLGTAALGPASPGLDADGPGAMLEIAGAPYYADYLPLREDSGQLHGQLEVALPVEALARAERRAQSSLVLSTLGVALVASVGAALYAGRLIRPLRRLTQAARAISRGDLSRPVPSPRGPVEVVTLARALEEGRANTERFIGDLARQNAWLDTLITSIVEGIVTFEDSGVITSFSPGAESITGWASVQAVGHSVEEVLRLADGSAVLPLLPAAGSKVQLEVLTQAGRPATLSITGAELRAPGTGDHQRALVLRDTTEEEATQRLRSYFLANISHEFRTPLSAISAALELLLEELEGLTTAEIGNLLGSMHMSVTGLQTLIDNLLESLSIEAGRFALRRSLVDLSEVIQEAAQTMQPLLERRRQPLEIELPANLPWAWIDPTRVTQVIVNLLSNASKYSPVGATIAVRGQLRQANELRIEVIDRGQGIPAAERQSIFRRFMRLNRDRAVQYGVGLGLSVVKSIVEEHGGQVGVEGRPGGGSIFWFSLPLRGEQS